MANLEVTPGYLDKLAGKQDTAATEAAGAAMAAAGVGTSCWITHGVISGSSNGAFDTAEEARAAAGNTIAQASVNLAAKLRTGSKTYAAVDDEVSGNINKQVLPR
jgi:uncharacterized protein YukE